jgi:hypothetical protein
MAANGQTLYWAGLNSSIQQNTSVSFNTAANWSTSATTYVASVSAPTSANDVVVVLNGTASATYTISANTTFKSFTIQDTATNPQPVYVSTGAFTLSTINNFTSINASKGVVAFGQYITIPSGGTLSVGGNLSLTQPAAGLTNTNAINNSGILTVARNTVLNSNTGVGGSTDINTLNGGTTTFTGNLTLDDGTSNEGGVGAVTLGGTSGTTTGTFIVKGNLTLGPWGGVNVTAESTTIKFIGTSQTLTDNGQHYSLAIGNYVFGDGTNANVVNIVQGTRNYPRFKPYVNCSILNNSTVTVGAGESLYGFQYGANGTVTGTFSIANGGKLILQGNQVLGAAGYGSQAGSNFPNGYSTYSLGATSTVEYDAAGKDTVFSGVTYGNLTIGDATTKPATNALAGGALTVEGNLAINSAATLNAGSYAHTIGGNWTNSGTFVPATSTVTFNGAAKQTLTGVSSFYGLAVNNSLASASGGLSLANNVTVTNLLTLTNGEVTTASATLLISNTAANAVSGGSTASFVNGPLQRALPAGLTNSSNVYNFPVGAGGTYLPYSATSLSTGATGATLQVQAFAANAGGTGDGTTLATTGLSKTEYWESTVISGNYTNASISLTREAALGSLNAIGRSSSAAGVYSSLAGTVSGTSIDNSNNTGGGTPLFYLMAKAIKSSKNTNTAIAIEVQPKTEGVTTVFAAHVSPNPAPSAFHVQIESSSSEDVSLTVVNMLGVKVYEGRGGVDGQYSFGETFAKGIYILQIRQGNEVHTVKLVKGN